MPASFLVPWIAAALAALTAVLLLLRLRAEKSSLRKSEAEAASLQEKLRTAQKRSETRTTGDRRREDEVGELRRKLEKAKKRANQAREEQLSESHRIKALEDRLRLRDADLRAVRTAATREVAVEPARPAPPAATPAAARPAPRPPPPVAAPEAPAVIESEALAAASKRAEQAEAERKAAQVKLDALEVKLKRLHGKTKTQDKLYASVRLELEAKKDRLGAQQEEIERLRAMKVALMDSPSDDAPPLAAGEASLGSGTPAVPTTE